MQPVPDGDARLGERGSRRLPTVSTPASALPYPGLNPRQIDTVERLFDAAAGLLDEAPYDELTFREVAARAGVSPATAYTYFSSKDHLFAALFWRHVATQEPAELSGGPVERLQIAVRHLADIMSGTPAMASAASKSLLAADPGVRRLRVTIGRHWFKVLGDALGDAASPDLLRAVVLAFSGALLEAGMGILAYEDLGAELETVVAVIARGNT